MTERIHQRVPFCLRVQFRNASSFLVAYSVNLSRGGVFLESDEPLPVGSEIALQVEVPDAGPVTLAGRVTWRRERADVDGPVGFGVEFEDMVDSLGALIDKLVSRFSGITVLLVCPGGRDRVTVTRQLKSIIATAEVVGATDCHVAQSLLDDEIDLIVVDGDADTGGALEVVSAAQSLFSPVPSIVMSDTAAVRDQARASGASEVVSNPPGFGELHSAVMRALGRPAAVAAR
ncbi:MAG TPA: TIGR02266 family protein [Kofleriaceae bacterium]|nr:TIGR02266 family protein [Kofleriaceae bacterium]